MADREAIGRRGAGMSVGANLRPVTTSFSPKAHAYRLLRGALMEMDIYGEDVDLRLDERTLAERLGVSRTPVREAIACAGGPWARATGSAARWWTTWRSSRPSRTGRGTARRAWCGTTR